MQRSITHTADIQGMALALQVLVANPVEMKNSGSSQWIGTSAIWDTGAQHCVITSDLCARLKLSPRAKTYFVGVGGNVPGGTDIVYLSLSGDSDTFLIALAGVVETLPGNVDMLIGMDVITQGDFTVSTKNGIITVAFSPYPGKLKKLRQ